MICRYCGKEIPDGSVFCTECGHIIDESNEGKNQSKKASGVFQHIAFQKKPGKKQRYSGWVKRLLIAEIVAVILGFFLIAGALEAPGSYNRELNTVTLDFRNLFSDRNRLLTACSTQWRIIHSMPERKSLLILTENGEMKNT